MKKAKYLTVWNVWHDSYTVQKQTKLFYGDKSKYSGYFCVLDNNRWEHKEDFWEADGYVYDSLIKIHQWHIRFEFLPVCVFQKAFKLKHWLKEIVEKK